MLRPFLIALQFLTIVPLRLQPAPQPREQGQSLLWYPLVGLLIGGLLYLLDGLLIHTAPMLRAALLLTAWVVITGALHLDGLADTVDAWIGGHGDRARTLEIMKDPRAGPVAVVAVVLVLLLKFVSLCALPDSSRRDLLLAPMLARAAMLLLFASTAYVRTDGLGSALADNLSRPAAVGVAVLTALACVLICGIDGIVTTVTAGFILAVLRGATVWRLGGFTGDAAGQMLELTEVGVLVVLLA